MSFSWPSVLSTPWLQLWLLPLAGMTVLMCLIAIWAANSQRHWFLRALAIWAAVLLMIPIAAWEPAWVYAVALPLVIVLLKVLPGHNAGKSATEANAPEAMGRREPFRFSLRDLFLLLLYVGLCSMGVREIARHGFPASIVGWLVSAATLAIVAALTCRVVVGPKRMRAALLLIGVLPAGAAANWATGDWMRVLIWLGASSGVIVNDLLGMTIVIAEFTLLLLLILALIRALRASCSMMRRLAAGIVLAMVVLAVGVPTAAVYWGLAQRVPVPGPFVAPTNHYPRILAIADELRLLNPQELAIASLGVASPGTTAPQQVEGLYAELFLLLESPNAVPYDPEVDVDLSYKGQCVSDVQTLRSVVRMIAAEGDAARLANEPERTAECAEASMRLGGMLQRGGLGIHALVGAALEGVANHQLALVRDDLGREELRASIDALQRMADEREDADAIDARDLHYHVTVHGWQARLEDAAARLVGGPPWYQSYRVGAKRTAATNALLQTELAIRLFQQNQGRLPAELSELVPACLPAVPLDPYDNQPLRYRLRDGSYVLYSVGYDGNDDRGRFGNRGTVMMAGYDLDIDTWTRP